MKTLVLLSGGQDSTTVLFDVLNRGRDVVAFLIHYGQKHSCEMGAALKVLEVAKETFPIRELQFESLSIPYDTLRSTSPLLDHCVPVRQYDSVRDLPEGLENTFIPCRNILFLTLAANRAIHHGCDEIAIGVSSEDYGGYPDCRKEFLDALTVALRYGTDTDISIYAPLLADTKAETVKLAQTIPGAMEALAFTHTCYQGQVLPCNHCHACLLRAKGFEEAGVVDPLLERLKKEAQPK